MKVAYNNCFGGFGLSPVGLTAFAKLKGVDLVWYNQTGYRHNNDEKYVRLENVPTTNKISTLPLVVDHGAVIHEIPRGSFYYPDLDSEEMRCDEDLISVIETLGPRANGLCASLAIAEIPDNSRFEITCYDGNESVVPPRSSW